MRKTGTANLPLHGGKAPRWLFERMVELSRAIAEAIVILNGQDELLRRLADPFWFQAFGCILGFDWHSSGLTTTVMGAMKEALRSTENDIGIIIAGGKGATSRRTPLEIRKHADRFGFEAEPLIYASRMSAKVDSAAVQDGYQIYHHTIIFSIQGKWTVIQQGMNGAKGFARRYHWLSDNVVSFVEKPHSGIAAEDITQNALDMTANESKGARKSSVELSHQQPQKLVRELNRAKNIIFGQPSLFDNQPPEIIMDDNRDLTLPRRHYVALADISPKKLEQIFLRTYEQCPENYENLIGMSGVGPATVRALALLSELLMGKAASYSDPARFSYAHGGKDGYPYPVNKENYDRTIHILMETVKTAKIDLNEKEIMLRKLKYLF